MTPLLQEGAGEDPPSTLSSLPSTLNPLYPPSYRGNQQRHAWAQDVEEADKWDCMTGEMNGYKTLGYTELIAPLVAYVQKLEERIAELEREK